MVWALRLVETNLSCRSLERCWESADCESSTYCSRLPTDVSPLDNASKIFSRLGLAIAERRAAFFSANLSCSSLKLYAFRKVMYRNYG